MILHDNQRINIVVRALIFRQGQLLLTQWRQTGDTFLIGGRVEFGEPLVDALRREVREETGAEVASSRLVYFGECVFTTDKGIPYHEFGWYFEVVPDRPIGELGQVMPNPDHPDLVIRYLPLDEQTLSQFWPRFLRQYLVADLAAGFSQNPRYVYSYENGAGQVDIREYGELGPFWPAAAGL